jgi:hypothetical protein
MPHHRRHPHAHSRPRKNVAIDPAPTLMSCSGRIRGRQEGLWCSTGPRILHTIHARVERNITRTGVPARHNGGTRPRRPLSLPWPSLLLHAHPMSRSAGADEASTRSGIEFWQWSRAVNSDPRRPAGTVERGSGSSACVFFDGRMGRAGLVTGLRPFDLDTTGDQLNPLTNIR